LLGGVAPPAGSTALSAGGVVGVLGVGAGPSTPKKQTPRSSCFFYCRRTLVVRRKKPARVVKDGAKNGAGEGVAQLLECSRQVQRLREEPKHLLSADVAVVGGG